MRVKLLPSALADLDGIFGLVFLGRLAPMLFGGAEQSLTILGVKRVHHVIEIRSIRPAILDKTVREVEHKARIVLELGVKLLD